MSKIKHGMAGSRPYNIWFDVKRRCSDPSRKNYPHYGGRGISYSAKWEDFEGFWEDMQEGYSDVLTLERVDVNGNYCKENCTWVTQEDQKKNKRGYSNNTLGKPNISICAINGIANSGICARIQETGSKRRISKKWSIAKYGLDQCIQLAEEWLRTKRLELGYKEGHGT